MGGGRLRPSRVRTIVGDPDHEEPSGPLEDNPIWRQENLLLRSVGIDAGTSGTQVIFSRLHLRRVGEDLATRYVVVDRQVVYRSPVRFTPYRDRDAIDAQALGAIVDEAYAAARLHPDDIDTGVVILTGEALRRRNAARITSVLAERAGDFVCASAGHHMEALLAAYGSGAAERAHSMAGRVLNIDVGGGTTKLALLDGDRVIATGALDVGGRLVIIDEGGRIVRLEKAGSWHARRAGIELAEGAIVGPDALRRVAEGMADALLAALRGEPLPVDLAPLWLTAPVKMPVELDGVLMSGGVAEYVYERESHDHGDLGPALGAALRARVRSGALPAPLLPAGECIRATVVGASQYSVQVSGSTIYVSDAETLLPRRNVQVLRPAVALPDDIDPDYVAEAIRRHMAAFEEPGGDGDVALVLEWSGPPSHARLLACATGIARGLEARIVRGKPLYLVLDGDVGASLGAILREELDVRVELLVVDGLRLWDLDYVDLGRLQLPAGVVPVTVKSLVFAKGQSPTIGPMD